MAWDDDLVEQTRLSPMKRAKLAQARGEDISSVPGSTTLSPGQTYKLAMKSKEEKALPTMPQILPVPQIVASSQNVPEEVPWFMPKNKEQVNYKKGGVVHGKGKGDVVPALLEPGEIVIPKKEVMKRGTDHFKKYIGKKKGKGKSPKAKVKGYQWGGIVRKDDEEERKLREQLYPTVDWARRTPLPAEEAPERLPKPKSTPAVPRPRVATPNLYDEEKAMIEQLKTLPPEYPKPQEPMPQAEYATTLTPERKNFFSPEKTMKLPDPYLRTARETVRDAIALIQSGRGTQAVVPATTPKGNVEPAVTPYISPEQAQAFRATMPSTLEEVRAKYAPTPAMPEIYMGGYQIPATATPEESYRQQALANMAFRMEQPVKVATGRGTERVEMVPDVEGRMKALYPEQYQKPDTSLTETELFLKSPELFKQYTQMKQKPEKPEKLTMSDVRGGYSMAMNDIKNRMMLDMTPQEQELAASQPPENLLALLMSGRIGKQLSAESKQQYKLEMDQINTHYSVLEKQVMERKGVKVQRPTFAQPETPTAQTPSPEDIAFTAKKYGITEEEVKKRLGIR